MSSVPNYVGTASEVQSDHDVGSYGPNVPQRIAPPQLTFSAQPDPREFVHLQAPLEFLDQMRYTATMVQNHDDVQNQMFMSQALGPNFNPGFVPGAMDYPVLQDMEIADPFTEYAQNVLKHNALFNLNTMRAPN